MDVIQMLAMMLKNTSSIFKLNKTKGLKTKLTKIFFFLLFIIALIFVIYIIIKKHNTVLKFSSIKKLENFKSDSSKIIKSDSKLIIKKKLHDTTVVLNFNDLSNYYNYKIIDKYFCVKNNYHYDSIFRVIKIFNKNDSLIQKIYPNLQMTPWYFPENKEHLRLSRSYITGKDANYSDMDNYCGEIVVADLNFDGFEDLATPVDQGADNGPHYAFYIQNKNRKLEYNNYLTENVIWFPGKINDSLMTFTSSVPCSVYDTWYQTYKFDTILKKWRKIENYVINNRTGKLMK